MTTRTAVLFSIIVLLGSCGKSGDPAPTREQLLTQSKGWMTTSITIDPGVFGTTDYFSTLNGCIQDDVVFFTSNGHYRKEEGATRCSSSDPNVWDEGTWTLNKDKTVITETSSTGGPLDYMIIDLSASAMKVSLTQTVDSVSYTFIFTSTVVK